MISTLTIVHVIVSILLIVVVLLQFGKGAETGLLDAASGGTNFVPKGNLLSKTTVVLSILFLGLCIALARLRSNQTGTSVFDDNKPATARPLNMDQVNKTVEDMKEKTNKAVEDVKMKAKEAGDKAGEKVKDSAEKAKDVGAEMKKKAMDAIEKAKSTSPAPISK